jgi:hypothetical protein
MKVQPCSCFEATGASSAERLRGRGARGAGRGDTSETGRQSGTSAPPSELPSHSGSRIVKYLELHTMVLTGASI